MKNIAENKSSYNKLYLIDSEMYNRVLPHLNEVDRQELNDFNEKKPLFWRKPKWRNFWREKWWYWRNEWAPDPTPKDEEASNDNPTIPVVEKTPEKTSEKKVKMFACEICVDKKFTKRQSLKRHNKTFHSKKHSIKETQVNPEVIYPDTSLPATREKASFIEEPKSFR